MNHLQKKIAHLDAEVPHAQCTPYCPYHPDSTGVPFAFTMHGAFAVGEFIGAELFDMLLTETPRACPSTPGSPSHSSCSPSSPHALASSYGPPHPLCPSSSPGPRTAPANAAAVPSTASSISSAHSSRIAGSLAEHAGALEVPVVERDPWSSFQTYSGAESNSTGAKKPSSSVCYEPMGELMSNRSSPLTS